MLRVENLIRPQTKEVHYLTSAGEIRKDLEEKEHTTFFLPAASFPHALLITAVTLFYKDPEHYKKPSLRPSIEKKLKEPPNPNDKFISLVVSSEEMKDGVDILEKFSRHDVEKLTSTYTLTTPFYIQQEQPFYFTYVGKLADASLTFAFTRA